MKHNNDRGIGHIVLIVIVFVLLAVGVSGWFVYKKQNNNGNNNSMGSSQSSGSSSNASGGSSSGSQVATCLASTGGPVGASADSTSIIKEIKDGLAKSYKVITLSETKQLAAGEVSLELGPGTPAYKVDGYNFYTTTATPNSSLSVAFYKQNIEELASTNEKNFRICTADTYKKYGLAKTGTYLSGDTDVYFGNGKVCTIESPAAGTSSNVASCGMIKDYKQSAEQAKPFADVYPNSSGAVFNTSGLVIKDSPVQGYQNVKLGINFIEGAGVMALYYRKDQGPWVYFKSAQEAPGCSTYNTDDLRSAFKGDKCYDSNGQLSEVR